MVRSVLFAGVVALSIFSPATAVYNLDPSDNISGDKFFDFWYFRATTDPTHGFVDYQTRAQAESKSLIGYNTGKARAFVGVDNTNKYALSTRGRPSVRLESRKTYTKGMFIADLFHVPEQACGIWPAFWTVNKDEDYPRWGEIDILENINEQTSTLNVLHTKPDSTSGQCKLAGGNRMTDIVDSYDCNDQANNNQGCAARNTAPGVYGSSFNAQGGGVVVMEWTTHFIKMWNFPRNKIPQNIKDGKPDTASWGTPAFTTEGGDCVIGNHFRTHQIIFDTTFCGDYAGQDQFWQQTSCYKNNKTKYPKCADYVAANPQAFANAYWIINSVKVYKWTD